MENKWVLILYTCHIFITWQSYQIFAKIKIEPGIWCFISKNKKNEREGRANVMRHPGLHPGTEKKQWWKNTGDLRIKLGVYLVAMLIW